MWQIEAVPLSSLQTLLTPAKVISSELVLKWPAVDNLWQGASSPLLPKAVPNND